MILVTGPDRLRQDHHALRPARHATTSPEVNIVTVEDPIEYQLAGINQVQVNTKAGLTFASALRSILRQDPDVILVGEMRDRETAEIAFQAAMTGHMVLSTLHTNSAVAAVTRMLDLGVDPSMLASSLTMVIAQRLVRRICNECREEYEPGTEARNRVGLFDDRDARVHGATAAPPAAARGSRAASAIYEIFRPTNAIRKIINDQASEADLRYAARQAGMVLLREDALDEDQGGHHVARRGAARRAGGRERSALPGLQALIEADFATCPYCRRSLKTNCSGCGQALRLDWQVCPYCNTNALVQPMAEDTRGRAAARSPPCPPAGAAAGRADGRRRAVRAARRCVPDDARRRPRSAVPEEALREQFIGVDLDAGARKPVPAPAPAPPPAPTPAPAPRRAAPAGAKARARCPACRRPPASCRLRTARSGTAAVGRSRCAGRRPLRVLVVDDDADIRMIVSATLRKLHVPVEVVQAEDGMAAVEKAKRPRPTWWSST